MKQTYRCIGIMTGNSLDAVDLVLTEFNNNQMSDIYGYSLPIPKSIAEGFRGLKEKLSKNDGDIAALADSEFHQLHDEYIQLVAFAVNSLIEQNKIDKSTIDAIGFHGQTCAHCPPSISPTDNHTLQIGSGQMLSDLTQIPVAFDFRSDDLMNGGEAAPLAPVHNQHLAQDLKAKGIFPVAFCNGGNTGNMAIIYEDKVMGFDTGPFNHLVDYLTRTEKAEDCDFDGKYGKKGKVNTELLQDLFDNAVRTKNGDNFLLKTPPKSSDPQWYKIIPALIDKKIPFEDRVHTAEFFSAYIFAYSLSYSPIGTPDYFLVFGGGWHNPVIRQSFEDLLHGKATVLPQHKDIFDKIKNEKAIIEWSDTYGYDGKFMEARIFADMAKCLLTKEPFSFPATTGCKTPTIGGVLVQPNGNNTQLWSRAAKGWQKK